MRIPCRRFLTREEGLVAAAEVLVADFLTWNVVLPQETCRSHIWVEIAALQAAVTEAALVAALAEAAAAQVRRQVCQVLVEAVESAMLSAACWADGLAIVEREQRVVRDDPVAFLSFTEFL